MVMKHSHAAWKCSMAKQHGHTAETNGLHMWRGHAGLHFKYMQKDIICGIDTRMQNRQIQQGNEARTFSMEIHSMDMQYVHVARTCSMEKRHGCSLDVQQVLAA